MQRAYQTTLEAVFRQPAGPRIKRFDLHVLLLELGATITEEAEDRLGVRLFNERWVFHQPRMSPYVPVGTLASLRKWLEVNGVRP